MDPFDETQDAFEETEDPFLGTTVADKYEIVSLLGGGGAGLVYKATQKLTKETVAVKVLFPHMVLKPEIVQRFKQEARSASRLSHPNIVTIFDYGTAEKGQPYLVMDYLEGCSLDEIIEGAGALKFERALEIFIQACDALGHAHEKGVIHRDLKAANFMLTNDNDGKELVKLIDFGLAKAFPQEDETIMKLTKTGQIFGSPHYMAPEQCRGGKADARSDVYAMGCLMYAALAGKPPFVSEDLVEILQAHLSDDPPLLPLIKGENYQRHRMEAIIWRCMSKDPNDRYQSVEDLKKDLLAAKEKPKSLDRANNLFKITSFRLKNFAATPKRVAAVTAAFVSVVGGASIAVWYILLGQNIPYRANPQDLAFQITAKPLSISTEDISRQNLISAALVKMAEDQQGPNSTGLAEALQKKALFSEHIHHYADAAPLYKKLLDIRTNTDGPTSYSTGQAALHLADCYFEQQHFDEAKPLYENGVNIMETLWGPDHETIPLPLSNLCEIYSQRGMYSQAEQGLLRVIKIMQAQGSNQTTDYAMALSRLADTYNRAGDWDNAEKFYKMALECWKQFEGADQQNVIPCLDDLATVAKHKANLADAEDYLKNEVVALEKTVGPDNARTGRALQRLSDLLWQRYNFFEALFTKARANKILAKKNTAGGA